MLQLESNIGLMVAQYCFTGGNKSAIQNFQISYMVVVLCVVRCRGQPFSMVLQEIGKFMWLEVTLDMLEGFKCVFHV